MPSASPVVSVIVPVYNSQAYLGEALECLLGQSMKDFEVICVDDGSTDDSPAILRRYAAKDGRIRVLRQENAGAGAARNRGFREAAGEYVYFFDSDDLCDPQLLEKTVERARGTQADIVAFNFDRFTPDGKRTAGVGVHYDWLSGTPEVISYRDCPERIMNVINPTPWNKLYHSEFIREQHLRFEEIRSTNDVTFAAVSLAAAQRIALMPDSLFSYRIGTAGTITAGKEARMDDVVTAVESAMRQAGALPWAEEIRAAIRYFAVQIYISSLYRYVKDYTLPVVRAYYEHVHDFFNSAVFDDLCRDNFPYEMLYNRFYAVRRWTYPQYLSLRARRLIVSFTSYPARIACVPAVLAALAAQTHPADEIVLYLAAEQFPGGEADLPQELQDQLASGICRLRWCDDLKSHKKYYYAFQEYPDDIVVTVDDDIQYPDNLLERLYDSYLMYPDAVSARTVHLMTMEDGELLPYRYWAQETDGCMFEPSMQLFATGAEGILYPPHLLPVEMLDREAIMETCPYADDIWLKAMEMMAGVPVVLTRHYAQHKYIPGSQTVALYRTNSDQGENDIQMQRVRAWVDAHYGEGTFMRKLTMTVGTPLTGMRAVCGMFLQERGHRRREVRDIQQRLQRTYDEKAERGIRIRELEKELNRLNRSPFVHPIGFMRRACRRLLRGAKKALGKMLRRV